jgi:hypothetical protein
MHEQRTIRLSGDDRCLAQRPSPQVHRELKERFLVRFGFRFVNP